VAAQWHCGAMLQRLLFAALMLGAMPVVHAALFDDDEARRQISTERRRIDDLTAEVKAQQQALDARLAKIEEALKSQGPVLDLFTQIQALRTELNNLRGQLEVVNNNIENAAKRQRDMYIDLDTRLRRFEQAGAPQGPAAGTAPAAPAQSQPPGPQDKPPPAGAAPASGTVAAASAAGADNPAENRAYEMAQQQRRIGDYQGAIVGFQNFIKQYPKSTLAPRAQYWIGDSYFNMRDFKLAIASQQALIKTYPDNPTVADAMLNIASSQIEMGETIAGRKSLEDLVAKYPISEAADKAKRRLSSLPAAPAASAATTPKK
jgi:tol-pal system protein YbgF